MRVTREQRDEQAWFSGVVRAVEARARVDRDAEGWPIAPGRHGQVETALDRNLLAVFTTKRRTATALGRLVGLERRQRGDGEWRFRFAVRHPSALREVLAVIRLRRRRPGRPGGNVVALVAARAGRLAGVSR